METSEPYIYEGEFTNEKGEKIKYSQLRVDILIGDSKIPLVKKLTPLEKEFIKSCMENS